MRRCLPLALMVALACCASKATPRDTAADGILRLGPASVARPARVVTLAPSLTDTVLALGAGDRLVGVSRFDEAPEVATLPRVGGFIDPSVEAVVALKPELVLVSPAPGNRSAVERMAQFHLPILSVPLATEAEILTAIEEVGGALGLPQEGAALVRSTRDRLTRLTERAAPLPKLKTLVVYGWEPLVVAGPGSFADQLIRRAGGVNAAADSKTPYPTWTAEAAIRAAPEVILDASDVRAPARDRFSKMPGLSQARWVDASPDLFHPGPRLANAVEEMFGLLHPGVR